MRIIIRICPDCKNQSLDYDPDLKRWVCVWKGCNYEEEVISTDFYKRLGKKLFEP